MKSILLIGATLNYCGALKLMFTSLTAVSKSATLPEELLQFKIFTAGTAGVFGSLYLYLYFYPSFVIPFLIFGATLKTWAFLLSLYLNLKQLISRRALIEFGFSNGFVAALFWWYIATEA